MNGHSGDGTPDPISRPAAARHRKRPGAIPLSLLLLLAAGLAIRPPLGWSQAFQPGPAWLRAYAAQAGQRHDIIVEVLQPLSFGRVVPGFPGGGSVRVDAGSGLRHVAGGATTVGGHSGPAVIVLQGPPHADFTVELAPEARLNGPSGELVLSGFTIVPGAKGTLGSDGTAVIHVGATLSLHARQPPGHYEGLFGGKVAQVVRR